MSKFSARLISLRKERKLSQEEMGKLLNKKRSTISGYETEGKEPDIETLCLFANFFDVSTDYLLGNSDSRKNVDTIFFGDPGAFAKSLKSLDPELRPVVEKTFAAFYKTLSDDIRLSRAPRLAAYRELFAELSRLRSLIVQRVESAGDSVSDPLFLSDLMALQSELKNTSAVLFDKLLQADMEVFFRHQGERRLRYRAEGNVIHFVPR